MHLVWDEVPDTSEYPDIYFTVPPLKVGLKLAGQYIIHDPPTDKFIVKFPEDDAL
jgi:hypothetical protein